eukprot:g25727.t1
MSWMALLGSIRRQLFRWLKTCQMPPRPVKGIVWMGYPGPLGGVALANILAGHVNPSGRMPMITPKRAEDYLPHGTSLACDSQWFKHMWQRTEARYPFGWGLSYTQYKYSEIAATLAAGSVQVVVQVANAGLETVQVYATCQACRRKRLPIVLAAFAKVALDVSETKEVKFVIELKDLSAYDAEANDGSWFLESNEYQILISQQTFQYPGRARAETHAAANTECQCVPEAYGMRIKAWSLPDKSPVDVLLVFAWARWNEAMTAVCGVAFACCFILLCLFCLQRRAGRKVVEEAREKKHCTNRSAQSSIESLSSNEMPVRCEKVDTYWLTESSKTPVVIYELCNFTSRPCIQASRGPWLLAVHFAAVLGLDDNYASRFENTTTSYKEWRRRVLLYARKLEIQGRKTEVALNVLSTLEGSSWTQCEDLDLKELESEEGLNILLKRLDKQWSFDVKVEMPNNFDAFFFKLKRRQQQTLLEYTTEFHQVLRQVTKHKVDLPEEVTGWMMLKRAGLTCEQEQMVQTQIGSVLTLGAVEQSLFLLFGQDYQQVHVPRHLR